MVAASLEEPQVPTEQPKEDPIDASMPSIKSESQPPEEL